MTAHPLQHRGAVVVDELVLPVLDVRLRRGGFELTAEVAGPAPAIDTDRYSVHDESGVVVYRRDGGGARLTWPLLRGPQDRLTVTVLCEVIDRRCDPGGVDGAIVVSP